MNGGVADDQTLERWRVHAVTAVSVAADHASARLRQGAVERFDKGAFGDLVTDLDLECEDIVVTQLAQAFPDHGLDSEEAGLRADGPLRWVIDPIDGTHNVAFGLLAAGVCVALVDGVTVLVAAIADVASGVCLSATRAGAVHRDVGSGQTLVDSGPHLIPVSSRARPNVSLIRGKAVPADDPAWRLLQDHLSSACHRVFQLWSPSYELTLFASGATDAMVFYRCDGYETPSTIFLAERLGASTFVIQEAKHPPWNVASLFAMLNPSVRGSALATELLETLQRSWIQMS